MSTDYQLVPVEAEHKEFLFSLFRQTFGRQLLNSGLPEDVVIPLVLQQFQAKEAAYRNDYPDAVHSLIDRDAQAVGQIRVDYAETEIRIVDISVLPDQQRKGIAYSVLGDILQGAQTKGIQVELTVERYSPALELYRRLGFKVVEENELFYEMLKPA